MKEYKQGQRVTFNVAFLKGSGKIVGLSTIGVPVLGRGYIIEPDLPIANQDYNYSHFVCFELYLTPIDYKYEGNIEVPAKGETLDKEKVNN